MGCAPFLLKTTIAIELACGRFMLKAGGRSVRFCGLASAMKKGCKYQTHSLYQA